MKPAAKSAPAQPQPTRLPFSAWWRSGDAWHWYSLFTLTVSFVLIIALMMLIVFASVRYFWPQALEEWVISSGEGESQRLFAYPLRTLQLPDAAATVTEGVPEQQQPQWVDAVMIAYQQLQEQRPQWVMRAVATTDIVRRGQPRSLVLMTLVDGSEIAGYALRWVQQNEVQSWLSTALQPVAAPGDTAMAAAGDAVTGADAANPDEQLGHEPNSLAVDIQQLTKQLQALQLQSDLHWWLVMELHDGSSLPIPVQRVDRLLRVNNMSWKESLRQAGINAWQFLSHGPDHGAPGILPAIYGTLLMVLVMSVLLVPVAVLTAIYLHEYAAQNWLTGLLRAVVSNLAGVPGVVYGVFVLGVFVYGVGGSIDKLLFSGQLPLPTLGSGGLLWAALALALLTMPVVITATEEGLARIPDDLRLASLALGATRTEMVWGVVVVAARPALLTGLILAIARAAGEVAPLLVLGAIAYTEQPLLDGQFPFLHVEQPFMHLGYQVYDFAMQSGHADESIAMAYVTTLVLVLLVVALNLFAFRLRASFVGTE